MKISKGVEINVPISMSHIDVCQGASITEKALKTR